MSNRTESQRTSDIKYRQTHKRVKLCNAEGTEQQRERLRNICKRLKQTQTEFILTAIDVAEQLIGE